MHAMSDHVDSLPPPLPSCLSSFVLLLTLVIGDRITACTFSHSACCCSHLCIASSDQQPLSCLWQSGFVVMSTIVVQPSFAGNQQSRHVPCLAFSDPAVSSFLNHYWCSCYFVKSRGFAHLAALSLDSMMSHYVMVEPVILVGLVGMPKTGCPVETGLVPHVPSPS
jgi:hypothetical protein